MNVHAQRSKSTTRVGNVAKTWLISLPATSHEQRAGNCLESARADQYQYQTSSEQLEDCTPSTVLTFPWRCRLLSNHKSGRVQGLHTCLPRGKARQTLSLCACAEASSVIKGCSLGTMPVQSVSASLRLLAVACRWFAIGSKAHEFCLQPDCSQVVGRL